MKVEGQRLPQLNYAKVCNYSWACHLCTKLYGCIIAQFPKVYILLTCTILSILGAVLYWITFSSSRSPFCCKFTVFFLHTACLQIKQAPYFWKDVTQLTWLERVSPPGNIRVSKKCENCPGCSLGETAGTSWCSRKFPNWGTTPNSPLTWFSLNGSICWKSGFTVWGCLTSNYAQLRKEGGKINL